MARSDAMSKELAGVAQRTAHSEAKLEVIAGRDPKARPKSTSAADERHAGGRSAHSERAAREMS